MNEVVDGQYTLTVFEGAVGGGDFNATDSVIVAGAVTHWDPFIGHMELGPEEVTSGSLASFWMDAQPACLNAATGEVEMGDCGANFFFYSIEDPGAALGAQGAYSYTPVHGGANVGRFGVDSNGVEFIEGTAQVIFSRNQPAIGEVAPAQILVKASFTAVSR